MFRTPPIICSRQGRRVARLSRVLGAVALAFACTAGMPPAALAYDIGEVIDAMRLGRYPLNAPERRVWGTENARDALLVGQVENRLFFYRYLREGGTYALAFRSPALVIDPDAWRASREERVTVAQPRGEQVFYWVAYAYSESDGKQVNGYLVDATGEAATVRADAGTATVTSTRPWDAARQAQAMATLRGALVSYPSRLAAVPPDVRFVQQAPADTLAAFRALHQAARAIPRAKTAEFGRALAQLRTFVMEHDYREIDPGGESAGTLLALNDYAFWLAETGDAAQADLILGEVLRRDPSRTAAYLNRADARWQQSGREREPQRRDYYLALAREDYRQYCTLRMASNTAIPSNVAARIGAALGEPALTPATCRPRLEIFAAIKAGDLEAVRAQLARGQDPDGVNEYGVSALGSAVYHKQAEIVRTLLAAGAKADGPGTGRAMLAGAMPVGRDTRPPAQRYAIADMLLAAGASVEAPDHNGTPLLITRTSYYGDDRDTLEYLLSHGANPNARDKPGRSVLHAAISNYRTRWFAEQLLARGADINAAYIRMYYGASPQWETPLLEALRASYAELKPGAALAVPERVAFALDHGADASVGGYGVKTGVARNGMDEALSLSARYLQPALVDRLAQASRKPAAPLTSEPMSALLRTWSELELRAAASKESPAWDGLRASARAVGERMVAAGVSLKYLDSAQGMKNNGIAPLSLPWLPDDLYLAWLKAGADQTDRTDAGVRIAGVDQPDALPLVTMMMMGQQAKVKMLLAHDGALYRDPRRCGMAVADLLSWRLGRGAEASPELAGAVSQVMDGAARAGNCDMSMTARARPFAGERADELARRVAGSVAVR